MTNRKTIERLKAVRNYLCAGNPIWDVNEMRDVFELAISALQAQDSPKPTAGSVQNVQNEDLISRKAAIDALMEIMDRPKHADFLYTDEICKTLNELPSAQHDGWLEQNKDKILQAGMEGREIDFRIGGRLFAIREKAQ